MYIFVWDAGVADGIEVRMVVWTVDSEVWIYLAGGVEKNVLKQVLVKTLGN